MSFDRSIGQGPTIIIEVAGSMETAKSKKPDEKQLATRGEALD
jgi:hypothetical protein